MKSHIIVFIILICTIIVQIICIFKIIRYMNTKIYEYKVSFKINFKESMKNEFIITINLKSYKRIKINDRNIYRIIKDKINIQKLEDIYKEKYNIDKKLYYYISDVKIISKDVVSI